MDYIKKGNLAIKVRNIFKEIEEIYEDPKLDEKSKITQITTIITKNKKLFEKKTFLKNKSVFDIIKQINTKCSPITSSNMVHTIDKKILYLEKNPELTKLIGKILKEEVQQSIDPINNEDDFCEDLETSECASKNYNRNQVICNLQKGTEIENAENSKSCTMANKCKRTHSNVDDKVIEEDKTEEEQQSNNEEQQSDNVEPQSDNEKVTEEPQTRQGWKNWFSRKSGGKYKKSTKRKNKITKKKKKSKRKTRSKK